MTLIDYVIIGLALSVVALTITISVRNKKKGKTSCGCDCGKCNGCGLKNNEQSHSRELDK